MNPPDFSQPVSGPAYGKPFRFVATVVVLIVLVMAARASLQLPEADADAKGYGLLGLGLLALLGAYWVLIQSKTTIDAVGIRQTGLTDTKVEWREVRSARLFGPPFARRLLVRTMNGRFRFFYGASPELMTAFARIEQAYKP